MDILKDLVFLFITGLLLMLEHAIISRNYYRLCARVRA